MTTDDAGKTRPIEVEIEVPGTPEQVWEAIATGSGITAWFMPAEVAEREGGTITMRAGAGMESTGVVSAWDPPRWFAYEADFQPTEGAGAERIATEFLVEASAGGSCVVRVVMSGFGSGADWERAVESFEGGWRTVLNNLRLYLTHFPGQQCSTIVLGAAAPAPKERAWAALTDALGLPEAAEGERVRTTAHGAPPFAGVVERPAETELTLRIDEPGPGLAFIATGGPGKEVFAFARIYLYGDEAPAIAAREEPVWGAWMQKHFASVQAASETGSTAG
jgi:uncharacterized protein YndB with AHSA1/START domain